MGAARDAIDTLPGRVVRIDLPGVDIVVVVIISFGSSSSSSGFGTFLLFGFSACRSPQMTRTGNGGFAEATGVMVFGWWSKERMGRRRWLVVGQQRSYPHTHFHVLFAFVVTVVVVVIGDNHCWRRRRSRRSHCVLWCVCDSRRGMTGIVEYSEYSDKREEAIKCLFQLYDHAITTHSNNSDQQK